MALSVIYNIFTVTKYTLKVNLDILLFGVHRKYVSDN